MTADNDNRPPAEVVRFICTGCGVTVFAIAERGRETRPACIGCAAGAPA